MAAPTLPVLLVTSSRSTLLERTWSHSLAGSGSVSAFDQTALIFWAPLMAAHSLVATSPRKLPSRTTLTMPATSLIEVSSTLSSLAPMAGGRTTRPCSMPGTRKSCM